ncbi:co-chaperone HscB [Aeromonas hydrophila]|uniref:co-chaperone HscB n=1 Tax=Aeromonas hydrophila TaxID=644 RepID=UPI001650AF88|nr:co-chaperone HscB [Aeromonas hydrophila]MBC6485806.1 Fe-S protein assembly co-chaperone HscB [Aeromonas hydrophila]UCM63269.1 co-chaperone HscB [Aeromonas hydrophila]UNU30123.1 co-chaperone HscB [Aeromonas hydrophila]WPC71145.1 co-chaperone HscB [Aeromonas hydrophila]
MNYFELFGLVEGFELDTRQLAETYRQLQTQFHPDRFATASEREQLAAVQRAAQINDAFTTLKAPLRRAEYLLSLRGTELRGEQQTLQDTAFLMQQLEWRERLADLKGETDPERAIKDFRQEIRHDHQLLMQQLTQALATGEDPRAADCVRKLKFVDKLLEELERFEDSLFES